MTGTAIATTPAPAQPLASKRRLAAALLITLAFVVVEVIAGLAANSLALLTDAAHNITDVIALGLSWYALRLAARPADERRTFGYHRAGILVALLNSTTLVLIALGIFYEAYRRLTTAAAVQEDILIGVALLAFVVNTVTALIVRQGSRDDLNMRSAFLHLASDAASTLAAAAVGVVIRLTGWDALDPAISVLIGGLIVWNGWVIIRETVDILLESTPRDLDLGQLVRDVTGIEGVRGLHDLHVWSLAQNVRAMSAHVEVDDMSVAAGCEVQQAITECVRQRHNIAHTTLQLECGACQPNGLLCNLWGQPADQAPGQAEVPQAAARELMASGES
jgi:cobalt-zinc-cadmium efflux system protein